VLGETDRVDTARVAVRVFVGDTGDPTAFVEAVDTVRKLAADDGPLQMTLFDQHDLAEISHPDYPGERLVACRNPILARSAPASARNCWPPPSRPSPRSSPP